MTSTEHEKVVMTRLKSRTTVPVFGLAVVIFTIFSGFCAAATSPTPQEKLAMNAADYLTSQLDDRYYDEKVIVSVTPIDERITIPACPGGFSFHTDPDSLTQSYISVRAMCNSSDWYLFTNAQVTRTRQVVVTVGMISPGTILTSQNLQVADIDVNRIRHTAFESVEALLGARMKHRVRDGQPVQSNMLCFVCKGDRITISAEVGGMQVKTAGIAQQDGVPGDAIEVLNASSRKAIIAEVASTQKVVIHL